MKRVEELLKHYDLDVLDLTQEELESLKEELAIEDEGGICLDGVQSSLWKIMLKKATQQAEHKEDKSNMNLKFDYKCCWTCQYNVLDIGAKKYVCTKKQREIAPMELRYEEHKPTECKEYKQD